MTDLKKLPIGIESFSEIQSNNYYYVDKTKLIEMLLDHPGKVNLFTRPRRFGKSLNISMLHSFFEIGTNPAQFDGLYVSKNKSLCDNNNLEQKCHEALQQIDDMEYTNFLSNKVFKTF